MQVKSAVAGNVVKSLANLAVTFRNLSSLITYLGKFMQAKSARFSANTELVRHDIIEYTAKTKQNTPTECMHSIRDYDEVWLD